MMETGASESLSRDIVSSLLDPVSSSTMFRSEENQHPWRAHNFKTFNRPLLRLWDHWSGSQPDDDGCMKSRAERQRLDTHKSREESLTIHINHKTWIPTPYISFSISPSKIKDLFRLRAKRQWRGPHNLIVVNPNTRVRNGLPVLHVADEMKHYGIQDPSGNSKLSEYHTDHYICLWEVTKTEVVGCWQWDELVGHENWYEEIIMPAFRQSGQPKNFEDSLSTLFSRLSCKFITFVTKITKADCEVQVTNDGSDRPDSFGRSETSSEELVDDFDVDHILDHVRGEDGTNTDNAVEEANATDDIVKKVEESTEGCSSV